MTGLEWVFLSCAVVGGTVFILRMILLFMGIGDVEADVDVEIDMEVDIGGSDISDTGGSFELLSVQGITAFFMMFGLVGLACMRSGAHQLLAAGAAFAAGIFSMWTIAKIFQIFSRLQSSGTMEIENAIGKEGTVYLTVPAGGAGKVRVEVQGRLKVFEATSESDEELATGTPIAVTRVASGNILVVKRA